MLIVRPDPMPPVTPAHGLRRTNADKRKCVDEAVAAEQQRVAEGHDPRPNRELARLCGVSSQMIDYARHALTTVPSVYFVGADEGLVKIGWTSRPVRHRLTDLQTGSPVVIRVLGCIDCVEYGPTGADAFARKMEAFAHHIGRLGRKHGEWFDRDCAFHVYTVLSKAMPSKVRIGWTP